MSPRNKKRMLPRRDRGRLIDTLVDQIESPEQMLELLYWSREPDLMHAMRVIAAMPPAAQAMLCTFLAMAEDPHSVETHLDGTGKLTLSSAQVSAELAQFSEPREARIEIAPDFVPRIH